jgi:hypothetical protein
MSGPQRLPGLPLDLDITPISLENVEKLVMYRAVE